MCLDKITKRHRLFKKRGHGWKYFLNVINGVGSYHYSNNQKLPLNKWLNEKDYREDIFAKLMIVYTGIDYDFGWHVFLEKPDLIPRDAILKRVEYKSCHTLGEQQFFANSIPTIVAKYMKILP